MTAAASKTPTEDAVEARFLIATIAGIVSAYRYLARGGHTEPNDTLDLVGKHVDRWCERYAPHLLDTPEQMEAARAALGEKE